MVCGIESDTIGVDEADRGDKALALSEEIRAIVVNESITTDVVRSPTDEVRLSPGYLGE